MSANEPSTTEFEQALTAFTESCANLAKALKAGPPISDMDRLSLENNLALVQIHYSTWLREAKKRAA